MPQKVATTSLTGCRLEKRYVGMIASIVTPASAYEADNPSCLVSR